MSAVKFSGSFKIVITNSGQAVSLGSNFPPANNQLANRVDIQALSGNAGVIIVGDGQIASDGSRGGIALGVGKDTNSNKIGDVYNIELVVDLINLFINGTAGDGVMVNWYIGDRN